jgi:hypothetical protein
VNQDRLIDKIQSVRRTFEAIRDEHGNDSSRDERARLAQADFARACILAAQENPPLLPQLATHASGEPITPLHWRSICEALEEMDPSVLKIAEAVGIGTLNGWLDHAIDVAGAMIAVARAGDASPSIAPKADWWGPKKASDNVGGRIDRGTIWREVQKPENGVLHGSDADGLKVEPVSFLAWAERYRPTKKMSIATSPTNGERMTLITNKPYLCACGSRQQTPGECDVCRQPVKFKPKRRP